MSVYAFINQSSFFLAAILVCVSCLIFTLAQHHTDRPQNIIYLLMVSSLALSAVAEVICRYAKAVTLPGRTMRYVLQIGGFAYFLLHAMLPVLLLYYGLFATRNFQRARGFHHALYLIPFAVEELLVIANPHLSLLWHYDEGMRFHRGPWMGLIYVTATYYTLLSVHLFLFRWPAITRQKRRIILYSLAIALGGILIQMLDPFAATELFAESVGMMGLLLAFEYDEDRLDTATRVYNRIALVQDATSYIENGRGFRAICVRLTELETLQRVTGASDMEEVFLMMADYLRELHPRYMIYRVTTASFVLLCIQGGEERARGLASRISGKLAEGWEHHGRMLPLRGVVLYASLPEVIRTPEDILLMCDSPLPPADNGAVLMGEDLRAILNRANLETALHRGLSEHNFRIYYQPVYTADGSSIYSAESLMRLNDPEFGELPPNEFIPVAERNGMIEQLGEYTLEEVCSFLESGVPAQVGIRYINVNLSVVQCMNPDFAENVKRIVGRHTVQPSQINFEITETVASMDYAALDTAIRELKAEGFRFSMEGYGTGFSNLHSIFSLDLDMIKMDKRLLWDAEQSADGWTILENSVRLVHELGHEVVVVGIETQEQFQRMRSLAVDWYQGNYFSMPLTREELAEKKV